jgi:diguanylate cyclase (GGDEF)-like protein
VRHLRGDNIDTPAWAAPLEGRLVTHIAPIRDGLLGIATLDAGLGLLARERFVLLSSEQGLPSDNAWTFDVVDGRIYVAGIEGVWRLPVAALPDPAVEAVHAVTPEMVLSASGRERGSQRVRCCNGGAQARSAIDGNNLWFASISGALKLNTRAISYSQQPPTAAIEGLRHGDHWHAISESVSPIELDTGSRDIEIDFTGLNFREPRSLRFRYLLDGYDTNWVDAGSRRAAFYTNLPPGDYRFQIQASLPNGGGSNATLEFSLLPRWYERSMVRVLMAALGVCLLALLVLLRTRRYRAAQHKLEALIAERTQALSRANERLRQTNQVLAHESQTDPLTGLHNRRFLLDQTSSLFASTSSAHAAAFLLLDLDNFKQINDRYGHAVGDDVLVQLSRLLRQLAREGDQLLRWGGEEFLILLQSVQTQQAMEIAERIRSAVSRNPFSAGVGHTLHLTCSIGLSLHPLWPSSQQADWSLTLELADTALYRVKQEGRNGSIALIAGSVVPDTELEPQDGPWIDAMLANDTLRWLRPNSPAHLHAVRTF